MPKDPQSPLSAASTRKANTSINGTARLRFDASQKSSVYKKLKRLCNRQRRPHGVEIRRIGGQKLRLVNLSEFLPGPAVNHFALWNRAISQLNTILSWSNRRFRETI